MEQELKQAFDHLKAADACLWQAGNTLDFPAEIKAARKALDKARREVAIKMGHNERVAKLVSCGVEQGYAECGHIVSDRDMAYCLATWLFDRFGCYESFRSYDMCAERRHARLMDCKEKMPLGYEFYIQGNHDT